MALSILIKAGRVGGCVLVWHAPILEIIEKTLGTKYVGLISILHKP